MKFLLAMLCVLALVACSTKQDNPPVFWDNTPAQAKLAATLHARDVGGLAYYVLNTHSMEPFLVGGDWIVVQPGNYDALKVGQIITYRADWLPPTDPPVTHRLAQKDSHGWILDGDNNKHYEAHWRVTEKNYVGKVIAVYTTRHKS